MPKSKKVNKIFVLDTSVLLYDSSAVKNFEKHDVAIPITVLEELDSFKKGNSVTNLHAREFIRYLDSISDANMMQKWIPLNGMKLKESEKKKKVVLVSKDINLRLKARALSLDAEDYETIRIKDIDHLYRGKTDLEIGENELISTLYKKGHINPADLEPSAPVSNHFYILKNHSSSALGYYNPETEQVELIKRMNAYGITPRNAEQTFALHAIMDPDIQLVSITGAAGTGKTLLALAGALEQRREYRQIFMARPIVPLSNRDIGYLPGDAQSKIDPYMQPLWDNLNIIKNQYKEGSKQYKKIDEMVEQEKLQVVPLAYIRGRSFSNICFVVDEAQNLTPHEVKTIASRVGEGTKLILTGDVAQIDNPYLDASSNGLTYLVERMRAQDIAGHITLIRSERSQLAGLAAEVL